MSRSAGDRKKVPGPCSAQALAGLLTRTAEACCEGALKPGVLAGWPLPHPPPTSIHWTTLSSRSSEKVSLR